MGTLTPSFRRPNTIPSGAAHSSVISAIDSHDNSITDLNQAIYALKGTVSDVQNSVTSLGNSGSGSSETVVTNNITIAGGAVNNQSGNISYTTSQNDNGKLLIFSDSSPVSVTLNNGVTLPWYCFVTNQGSGLVTLTPQQNTINGNPSQTLLQGYFLTLFFDGEQFWSGNIPIVPVNTPAVAHEWLASYDAMTGEFTLSQPDFTDISGIAAVSQGGTGTATPSLIEGANITITGAWPNQTVSATTSGGYSLGGTLSNSNIVVETAAGSGATASIVGLDGNHQVTLTIVGATSAGFLFTVTFTASRGHTTYPLIQYVSENTIEVAVSVPVSSATSYTVYSSAASMITPGTYVFNVSCP